MARHSDPRLEDRILMAARDLWHQGGEAALSMRTVAKAAKTNTPAVYRRFRTREDILRALVKSYQQQLYRAVLPCKSLPEIGEAVLRFALQNPREYELVMCGLLGRMSEDRPNFEFVAQRCAEWFGGKSRDYEGLVFSLWALAHGTIMLNISGTVPRGQEVRARRIFARALKVLVSNASELQGL